MVKIQKWTDDLLLQRAADYLIGKFKEQGFTVMRYDAYSSKSIYLKLDEGVTGTLRISDHRGKKHLHYKYNLIIGEKMHMEKKSGGKEMFYFGMYDTDALIRKVLWDRQERIAKYGFVSYNLFRKRNTQEGKNIGGFWRQARYV